jgi:hypothetical protein
LSVPNALGCGVAVEHRRLKLSAHIDATPSDLPIML